MAKKSFNEKLNNAKDLPKAEFIGPDNKMAKRFGTGSMLIAAPIEYGPVIKKGKHYFVKDHEKALYQL